MSEQFYWFGRDKSLNLSYNCGVVLILWKYLHIYCYWMVVMFIFTHCAILYSGIDHTFQTRVNCRHICIFHYFHVCWLNSWVCWWTLFSLIWFNWLTFGGWRQTASYAKPRWRNSVRQYLYIRSYHTCNSSRVFTPFKHLSSKFQPLEFSRRTLHYPWLIVFSGFSNS